MENSETETKDLLKNISTETLIGILKERELTPQDIAAIQLLRPNESPAATQAPVETETPIEEKPSVERFIKAVTKKNIHGKLAAGTKINDVPIKEPRGFYDHGPDVITLPKNMRGPLHLLNVVYSYQKEFPDLIGSHFVTVLPSEMEGEKKVLTIHFFQDKKQEDSRGWCTGARVTVVIPDAVVPDFLSEISRNPDLLEDFYQRLYPDLDTDGDKLGLRRVKADGFYVIPEDKFDEASSLSDYDTRGARAIFNSLEKKRYKNGPYGTGDAFSV